MGQSSSSNPTNTNNHRQQQPQRHPYPIPPPRPPAPTAHPPPPPPPPPPYTPAAAPPPYTPATAPPAYTPATAPPPYTPATAPPPYTPAAAPYPYPLPPPRPYPGYGSGYQYAGPSGGRYGAPYYCPGQGSGWAAAAAQYRPAYWPVGPPANPPPPYVEHQKATTVKNVVNVHRETIRLEADEARPDCVLVCFTFDAAVDGCITICYFGKEGENCNFSPLYPDMSPVQVPFSKGPSQKFRQPSGTGVDLGFFEWDQLSKPMEDDVFPLVISAQANSHTPSAEGQPSEPQPSSPSAQITQAIIESKSGGPFQVRVVKQVLLVNGVCYELREIFGIGSSVEEEYNDSDPGKECVICMSEPKNTAVLPCRHMCMCSECAKLLRLQSNKCPICRQPVEQLMEIKVKKGDQ